MGLVDSLKTAGNSIKNFVVDHAEAELIIGGTVLIAGGVVTAVRAGRKIDPILEDSKTRKDNFNYLKESVSDYTDDMYKTDIRKVNAKAALDIGINVALPVALTAAGIGGYFWAFHLKTKKYNQLMTIYEGTALAFAGYRSRVKEELGENYDDHFMYGTELKNKKVLVAEETVDQDGNVTTTTKKEDAKVVSKNSFGVSQYARYFAQDTSRQWYGSLTYNQDFIVNTTRYANQELLVKGRLTLNDIYDRLGLERSAAGQAMGWTKGDTIDIRMLEVARPIGSLDEKGEEVYEKCLLLDFNCSYMYDDFKDIKFDDRMYGLDGMVTQ